MFASGIKKGRSSEDRSRGAGGLAVQHAGMLQGHGDELEWIQDHQEQSSSGQHASGVYGCGALHVYSQEQWRRGGTTQQDATQSFCENSSASFKRSLNVKSVLTYILHVIIVCDLLHPIVACRTLHGSTDPPCTLDMRIYPRDMMIVLLVSSYQSSIPTITGRF